MKNNLIKIIAVLALIFLTCSINVFGQVHKFKITSYSSILQGGGLSSSSSLDGGFLIDFYNQKITMTIGTTEKKVLEKIFEIVDTKKSKDRYGRSLFTFDCVSSGTKCSIMMSIQDQVIYEIYSEQKFEGFVYYLVKE